jgi:hypothetical protein
MLSRNLEKTLHRSLALANERKHNFATLEHLLLALTEDLDATGVLRACAVSLEKLRKDVLSYLNHELRNLVDEKVTDARPTASFQRALQRAAIHVQSSGREEVTGANVLVAMFAERESHAVYFLQEQDMSRFDAVNYLTHGIVKFPASQASQSAAPTSGSDVLFNTIAEELSLEIKDETTNNVKNEHETGPSTVFLSYSHRDTRWASRLEVHLRPVVDSGLIVHWHDRLITPGSKWREEIQVAIEAARIAILLVSADYLASEFIMKNELPPLLKAAEQRGCHILPIIAGHCRFLRTPTLAEFQAVNLPTRPLNAMNASEREALFLRVSDTIEDILRRGPLP